VWRAEGTLLRILTCQEMGGVVLCVRSSVLNLFLRRFCCADVGIGAPADCEAAGLEAEVKEEDDNTDDDSDAWELITNFGDGHHLETKQNGMVLTKVGLQKGPLFAKGNSGYCIPNHLKHTNPTPQDTLPPLFCHQSTGFVRRSGGGVRTLQPAAYLYTRYLRILRTAHVCHY
jgi:hypothetical protein